MTAMGVIGDVALVQHVEQGVAVLDHLVEHGGEGREVDGDAGEGVEHADGGGALVEEDDEAVGEAHDPVATELREADTEAPGRAGVEEGVSQASSGRAASPSHSATHARGRSRCFRRVGSRGEGAHARQPEQTARNAM
ncbi:hypothetical protein EE612_040412 [Oryza sativa]|nr:hypothetical protein EE612_040412 [Oryza sativa]